MSTAPNPPPTPPQPPRVVVLPDGRAPSTARGGTQCPDNVLRAIYGEELTFTATTEFGLTATGTATTGTAPVTYATATAATTTPTGTTATTAAATTSKSEQYDASLKTWWGCTKPN
jgi:hypothetical protein